ncbi:PQQ-like beta-propeller repeat protein [Streptomyces sp. NBC_00249]|uniref:outer membrane protein assembly factor BamB family protein n=1 Tax=Streptomyces sp. NBC_00249 TaxID=2975690 RepID=UPI002254AF1B|nr:PQQ-binding-like beta-propeller repeat protein [Streptomyces sp. NBC_00249]MCX5198702.1 PQQ-like beta-propeller repeat protein [Streptomyces sp. NBC_00249]
MDNAPSLARRSRDWVVGASALAAAVGAAAVALLYFVLFCKLVFVDGPGGGCDGDDCPRGTGWLLLFTPLAGFVTYLLCLGVRRVRAARGCLTWFLAVCVGLFALGPGWQAFEWMRGPQMDLSGWQVPDRPSSVKPVGVWGTGTAGMLVRARTDMLVAFDGEGRKGWRLPAPDRAAVCALSRTTSEGTGLVSYAQDGRGCGSRVEAVDVGGGGRLWSRDQTSPGRAGTTAVVGSTAVVTEQGFVVGLDLREGSERWRVELPPGCSVQAVDGAGEQVLYVEECAGTARVTAVDARTGARAWQTVLPTATPLREVRVLSARPLAVRVRETAERGTHAVLLFDAEGRARGSVPVSGEREDLLPGPPHPVVTGEVMVTPVRDGKRLGVSAYSLTDGRRLWHTGLGENNVLGLAVTRPGEVAVVNAGPRWTYLSRLDLSDGRPRQEPTVLRDLPLSRHFEFFAGPPGSYAFVNLDAHDNSRFPTFDIDPVWGW